MSKMGKRKFGPKNKKKIVKLPEPSTCDNLDPCNSSDEDFGALEPVSDGEGVLDVAKNIEDMETSEMHHKNRKVSQTTACKNSEEVVCGSSSLVIHPARDDFPNAATPPKSVPSESNISEGPTTPVAADSLALESTDSRSSADSVLSPKPKTNLISKSTFPSGNSQPLDSSVTVDSTGSNKNCAYFNASNPSPSPEKLEETDKPPTPTTTQDPKNVPTQKETESFVHCSSSSPSVCKSWTLETAGELTMAEVFLMLGKPGHFKLCYDWIKESVEPDAELKVAKVGLSAGVAALIQTASLLREKLCTTEQKDSATAQANTKSITHIDKKTANASVQCNLVDKVRN